jgi:hypothetical protein
MSEFNEAVQKLKNSALELRSVTVLENGKEIKLDLSGAFFYVIGFAEGITARLLDIGEQMNELNEVGRAAERVVYIVIAKGDKALKNEMDEPEGYA